MALAQETIRPDEAATIASFIEFLKTASAKRHPTGPIQRFNQGRHSGCVQAEFTVLDSLGPELRVGFFAQARTYPAWIRFANASSQTDRDKDVRGMSIKVFDAGPGNLTPGATTQDFVLNSHPVMVAPDTREFLDLLKAMEAGGFQRARYFLTHPRSALVGFRARQQPGCHLDIPYWSTTPYLFGPGRAVKYYAKPSAPTADRRPDTLTDTYLRDALRQRLARGEASFDFFVQFQVDEQRTPIEDAMVEWTEAASPYVRVGTIRIPRQNIDEAETERKCESVAFSPWNSLPEHRPLGSMNRARKEIYTAMAAFRASRG
jgi:catalase